MTPQSSLDRKILYLIVIAVLLVPLSYLGRPATSDTTTAEGSPGGMLAQKRAEHNLMQSELGQIDPTSETIKLVTFGLRGIAANILWEKAHRYKKEKDWTNLSATLEQITRLQPNFISVWQFQAWNLSYNVSVEFDDFRDRYRWVIKGINFLKKGIEFNEREPPLFWDVGWFISQKIGRSDERRQFRRLFTRDDDFHGSRPIAERDNWLVGKEWFKKAIQLVENEGASMKGKSPLIYHSDPAMCQMNYAEDLEAEGTFGQKAEHAWAKAAEEWDEFGSRDFPTAYASSIRLKDRNVYEEKIQQMVDQLDALKPGLREELVAEKRAALTDQQREAIDTPMLERTSQQNALAAEAEPKLEVTHEDVAQQIEGEKRAEAIELAKQLAEAERVLGIINRYRDIVNYDFWQMRAEVEQAPETVRARELIFKADQAYTEGDLMAAGDWYDKGFAAWREVFDAHPQLVTDEVFGAETMDVLENYRHVLHLRDEPFPDDFILQDVLDAVLKHQRETYGPQ